MVKVSTLVNLFNLCYKNGTKKWQNIPISTINREYWSWTKIGKKLNDVNSFYNQINNTKEMIAYFIDKNNKSKKKFKKYTLITTILKLFDTFVFIATTSSSISLSLTEIGLILILLSTATACGSSIGDKVIYEKIKTKYNKAKNNTKKVNKLLNLLINYTENLYKIM